MQGGFRAVIGLLLIMGGIALMYGLFSGKIIFPLGSTGTTGGTS